MYLFACMYLCVSLYAGPHTRDNAIDRHNLLSTFFSWKYDPCISIKVLWSFWSSSPVSFSHYNFYIEYDRLVGSILDLLIPTIRSDRNPTEMKNLSKILSFDFFVTTRDFKVLLIYF